MNPFFARMVSAQPEPGMIPPDPSLVPQVGNALKDMLTPGSLRRGLENSGAIDAINRGLDAAAYYAGPHLTERFSGIPEAIKMSGPKFGTEDAQAASEAFAQGKYGKGTALMGLGVAGGLLDAIPGEALVKGILKGITKGAHSIPYEAMAALPMAAKTALPMDEASRMARAKEMGFTTAAYHETSPANAQALLGGNGFDLSRVGAANADSEMPRGVFVKSHDQPIGVAGKDPAQMPVMIAPGKQLSVADRSSLRNILRQDEHYRGLSDELDRTNAHYTKLTDDIENQFTRGMSREEEGALLKRSGDALDEWQRIENELSTRAQARATDYLRAQGYDSLKVGLDRGSWGRGTDTTVVLDPRNIRSRDAAFDPARRDSTNLLASLFGVGLGVPAAMAMQPGLFPLPQQQ